MESALITSPSRARASRSDNSDLPEAVGPTTAMTGALLKRFSMITDVYLQWDPKSVRDHLVLGQLGRAMVGMPSSTGSSVTVPSGAVPPADAWACQASPARVWRSASGAPSAIR